MTPCSSGSKKFARSIPRIRVTEPTSVLLLRIGLAGVKLTYQTQIESDRLWRRDTRVIKNLTDDVYPAAWIYRRATFFTARRASSEDRTCRRALNITMSYEPGNGPLSTSAAKTRNGLPLLPNLQSFEQSERPAVGRSQSPLYEGTPSSVNAIPAPPQPTSANVLVDEKSYLSNRARAAATVSTLIRRRYVSN